MIASIREKKPHVHRVTILKQMADHTPLEIFVVRFVLTLNQILDPGSCELHASTRVALSSY